MKETRKEIIQFDYDKIMQEKVMVSCTAKEQAKNLLKWADSKGLSWRDKYSYLGRTYWRIYGENTCYDLFGGTYGHFSSYIEDDYRVLSYEEVLKDKS